MLDWLFNTVYGLYGRVSGATKDLIHSVIRGLMGALNAVAGNMWAAWWDMVWASQVASSVIGWFGGGIYQNLEFIYNTMIRLIWENIRRLYAELAAAVVKLWNDTWALVWNLRTEAFGWVGWALDWVKKSVWDPLWWWVQDLYQKMRDWAYTAWYLVTHPDALADIMFWPLFWVFGRSAYPLARMIGDWLLRTALQNSVQSLELVEGIITDVL
jgi:hypothetical protein